MMYGFWGAPGAVLLVALLLVALSAAAGAAAGTVAVLRRRPAEEQDDRALRILDERLASGEIDVEEYRRLMALLARTG